MRTFIKSALCGFIAGLFAWPFCLPLFILLPPKITSGQASLIFLGLATLIAVAIFPPLQRLFRALNWLRGLVLGLTLFVVFISIAFQASVAGHVLLQPFIAFFLASLATFAVYGLVLGILYDRVSAPTWQKRILGPLAVTLVCWLAVMAVRTILFQPFRITGGSMLPTVNEGDYVFVAKYSYGYSRFSLPFSPPLFSGRVLASAPKRGDLVIFRYPKDDMTDAVGRIVGLSGDRVQMREGRLHINGQAVPQERLDDFIEREDGRETRIRRWRETLPDGASHEILDLLANGFYDNTQEYRVPAGHYFMMGDNRDNATDSRVLSQVGYVPLENLIGRIAVRFTRPNTEEKRPKATRNISHHNSNRAFGGPRYEVLASSDVQFGTPARPAL